MCCARQPAPGAAMPDRARQVAAVEDLAAPADSVRQQPRGRLGHDGEPVGDVEQGRHGFEGLFERRPVRASPVLVGEDLAEAAAGSVPDQRAAPPGWWWAGREAGSSRWTATASAPGRPGTGRRAVLVAAPREPHVVQDDPVVRRDQFGQGGEPGEQVGPVDRAHPGQWLMLLRRGVGRRIRRAEELGRRHAPLQVRAARRPSRACARSSARATRPAGRRRSALCGAW